MGLYLHVEFDRVSRRNLLLYHTFAWEVVGNHSIRDFEDLQYLLRAQAVHTHHSVQASSPTSINHRSMTDSCDV